MKYIQSHMIISYCQNMFSKCVSQGSRSQTITANLGSKPVNYSWKSISWFTASSLISSKKVEILIAFSYMFQVCVENTSGCVSASYAQFTALFCCSSTMYYIGLFFHMLAYSVCKLVIISLNESIDKKYFHIYNRWIKSKWPFPLQWKHKCTLQGQPVYHA